jgi:membrane protein
MLLLASFGLSVVVHAVQTWSAKVSEELGALDLHEWSILGNVGPAVLAFVAFVTLYRLVPPTRPKLRDVWAGALLAALGFAAVNIGFSYYLTTVARWDLLYGSLGSLLAFLLVVYLEVAVFLFGAELAAVWSRPPARAEEPQPDGPLLRRLLLALRGLFVRS